jgi:hypothetical protein
VPTKESIAEVRHLYLDLDTDGDLKLAALRSSNSVPIPTAIVSTSPGKYQVLWRVEDFTFEQQERALKHLAIHFGGDPACTDCNRVRRLPGYLDQKYDPVHPVSVEYLSDSTSNPADFRLDIEEPTGLLLADRICPRKGSGKPTSSEHDWAWVLHEVAHGKDAGKLTRALAQRRPDKPNPLYYAQRTVDVASARMPLLEGVPMDDVIRCCRFAGASRFQMQFALPVRKRLRARPTHDRPEEDRLNLTKEELRLCRSLRSTRAVW